MRTNATKFDEYTSSGFIFPKDVMANIRPCLVEDGDMSKSIGIDDNIDGFHTFATDLKTLSATTPPASTSS